MSSSLQSTGSLLYVLSHVGFALFAIVYTLLKDADTMEWLSPRSIRARYLRVSDEFCAGSGATVSLQQAIHSCHVLFDGALLVLRGRTDGGIIRRRACLAMAAAQLRCLDLWLMLVLFAYIIEIALTAFPLPYRFSVGWYAGRVYGVLSGGCSS